MVGPAYQVHLDDASHHGWIFEAAFSSFDDEVIADATCAWIVCQPRPTGSWVHYFAKRMGVSSPFSSRLRQVAMRAIEANWPGELVASDVELVRLLNRLNAAVGDLENTGEWIRLLSGVIRSTVEENLTSHYWHLLGELLPTVRSYWMEDFGMRDVEVMRSLRDAEGWEKLEVWMVVVWRPILSSSIPRHPTSVLEDIEDATLKLLSSRPSAFQRLKALIDGEGNSIPMAKLEKVLNEARARTVLSGPQASAPTVCFCSSFQISLCADAALPSLQPIGSHQTARSPPLW